MLSCPSSVCLLTNCPDGFDFQFRVRSAAIPVVVTVPDLASTLTHALIPALEQAYRNTTSPIKGLLLTNPHNPLGQCYPRSVLEECVRFCARHMIHLVFDEVYALTSFDCPELVEPIPFVSGLALNVKSLGGDPHRVHVIWSSSKDFGQSGVRMVCPCFFRLYCFSENQPNIFLSEMLNRYYTAGF